MIGIYLIKNNITNESYIGQSRNIEQRFSSHRRALKDKKYSLYSDMRFYGLENFTFSILETCSISQLDKREMFWIKKYLNMGVSLYNIIGVPQKERSYARKYQNRFKKYWPPHDRDC